MSRFFSLFLFSIIILSSCNSNEIGNSKDVNLETIFFDYRVYGEEDKDDVTVLLQYRFTGPNGTTLVLEEPSKVELDGKLIPTDSSKMTGAFYEVVKPLGEFEGNHSIVFTDMNKKQYRENFNFHPIAMRTVVPAVISRGDLIFDVDGLDPVDYVRVLLTDTAFRSEGINEVDTVKNGRIIISRSSLDNLVNGPVHLELIREDEKPVKSSTGEGGRLSVTFGLKREFVLQDSISTGSRNP